MPPPNRTSRSVLPVVLALLAVTSASTAAADNGAGPFGVTAVAAPTARADRAAHCLNGRTDRLVFAPGYRDGTAPHGVWTVGRWFVPDGWAKGRHDEDGDVAFGVVVRRGGKGVEDVVGGNRFGAGIATGATAVTVTGYLNSRETPVSCSNKPRPHSRMQQRISCPGFGGGTSGSPWGNGDGAVVGVLGGHEDGGATADVSYSVVFGAEAAELYREASRASVAPASEWEAPRLARADSGRARDG